MPEASSRSRTIVLIVLVIALVGGAAYFIKKRGAGDKAVQWTTAKADRGRITAKVTASGTLSALVTVQVGSQVSGRIAQLNVDYNSPVKKGQVIARIDPQLFQAAVEQAQANLQSAQANLAKAEVQAKDADRQANRADELVTQHLIAESDRDTARANADAAHATVSASAAAVAQSKASLNQAKVNLDYTTIASPTDGVVISRSVDVGQTVAASLQAPTLFVIAQDLQQMQVDTSVAESDIGKLTPDMPVTFTVDAYPQERFHGKVRQIRNAATTLQNVVTYDAVVNVDNPDLKLRPGMTANATFVYADKKDVLRVPNAALRFRPTAEFVPKTQPDAKLQDGAAAPAAAPATDQGQSQGQHQGHGGGHGARGDRDPTQRQAWVLREGKPVLVPVRTGVSDGSLTEIVEGDLKEGDDLITDQEGGSADKDKPAGAAGRPMRLF